MQTMAIPDVEFEILAHACSQYVFHV